MENDFIIDDFTTEPEEYAIASKGKRFANYVVDLIFFYVLCFGIGIVLVLVGYDIEKLDEINPLLDRLYTSIFLVFYYIFLEAVLGGKTLGKYITKTRAVMTDGSPMDSLSIMKRSFSRIVPFEQFSFLEGDHPRGWHDKWSDTKVIDESKRLRSRTS